MKMDFMNDWRAILDCNIHKYDIQRTGRWSAAEEVLVDDPLNPGSKKTRPIAVCRCSRKAYEANWTCGIVCDCPNSWDECDQCQCIDDNYAGPGCWYRVCRHQNRPLCKRLGEAEECQKNLNRNRTVDSYDECGCSNGGNLKQSGECECPDGYGGILCQKWIQPTYDPWEPPEPVPTEDESQVTSEEQTTYREPEVTPYPPRGDTSTERSGLSNGAIIGITFAAVAVVAVIIAITVACCMSRKGKKRRLKGPLPVYEYGGPPPPMTNNWRGYPSSAQMNLYPPDEPTMLDRPSFSGGPPPNYDHQAVEPSPSPLLPSSQPQKLPIVTKPSAMSTSQTKTAGFGIKPIGTGGISASLTSTASAGEIPNPPAKIKPAVQKPVSSTFGRTAKIIVSTRI